MKVLTVIPLSKKIYKEELTYFSGNDVPAGAIVSAPVRGKEIDALVVKSEDLNDSKIAIKSADFSLRKISKVKGGSFFLPEFLSAVAESKTYFACQASLMFYSLIPNIFLEKREELVENKSDLNKTKNSIKNIKCEKIAYQELLPERLSFYKIFIRNAISKKESVFICASTILQVKFLSESLKKGIESHIYVFHGGLSDKKQIELYNKVLSDPLPVIIIATGSYLFIPRRDIKSMILEDEGSGAFKSISRPFLDIRTFVEIFASISKRKLIFGGSLLRIETLYKKSVSELEDTMPVSYRLPKAPGRKIIESIEGSVFRPISETAEIAIKKEMANKKNVFIFVSRKGLATTTACRDCGEIVLCSRCSHTLVLYKKSGENIFKCNKCKNIEDSDKTCLKCKSWNLSSFGLGTEMIAGYAEGVFGKENVFRIDAETGLNKKNKSGKNEKISEQFENRPGSILVGTSLALNHLEKKITLSIVPSLDSLLSIPDFRINEKIMRTLFILVEKTEKEIFIQTKNSDELFLTDFISGKISNWVNEEFKDREMAFYPPFSSIVKISFSGKIESVSRNKKELTELFLSYAPEFTPAIRNTKTKRCLMSMIIKVPKLDWVSDSINTKGKMKSDLFSRLMSLSPSFVIEIDPEAML